MRGIGTDVMELVDARISWLQTKKDKTFLRLDFSKTNLGKFFPVNQFGDQLKRYKNYTSCFQERPSATQDWGPEPS